MVIPETIEFITAGANPQTHFLKGTLNMAKSDYFCGICKKVKGSDRRGNATDKYKCLKHGFVCRDCVAVDVSFFGSVRGRTCRECQGDVMLYEFNTSKSRWQKA